MIIRSIAIPVLAVAGLFSAINVVQKGAEIPVPPEPYVEPYASPFKEWVAGSGTIESLGEETEVGSPVSGVIEKIYITEGQEVKEGDPLFSIDSREFEAERDARSASVLTANAELQEAKRSFNYYQGIKDKRAVSADMVAEKYSAVAVADARVAEARAKVRQSEVEIERRTIRSPINGKVLRLMIEKGEFATSQSPSKYLLVLGDVSTYQVRVQIDETESWRIKKGAKAEASLRGARSESSPIEFLRIEPLIIPKRSLTGESNERVDTRVLEVIYTLNPKALPVRPGQLVDVFIEVAL
jgi:HlyD family secretion protein